MNFNNCLVTLESYKVHELFDDRVRVQVQWRRWFYNSVFQLHICICLCVCVCVCLFACRVTLFLLVWNGKTRFNCIRNRIEIVINYLIKVTHIENTIDKAADAFSHSLARSARRCWKYSTVQIQQTYKGQHNDSINASNGFAQLKLHFESMRFVVATCCYLYDLYNFNMCACEWVCVYWRVRAAMNIWNVLFHIWVFFSSFRQFECLWHAVECETLLALKIWGAVVCILWMVDWAGDNGIGVDAATTITIVAFAAAASAAWVRSIIIIVIVTMIWLLLLLLFGMVVVICCQRP